MDKNKATYTLQRIALERPSQDASMIVSSVCNALTEKGVTPISQLVGYILSDSPAYITEHNNARAMLQSIPRDELLKEIVTSYLSEENKTTCTLDTPFDTNDFKQAT